MTVYSFDKQQMRRRFLEKRLNLSGSELERKSQMILEKLMVLERLKSAKNICIYLPIKNEVETKGIINQLIVWKKQIFLPKYFKNGYHLVLFKSWVELQTGPFGILEPINDKSVVSDVVDVTILPGLAFDRNGVRLGYGKGVFDQMLANSNAFKIGLGYDFQLVDEISAEKHDLVMDLIVTEKRIIVI